MTREGTIYVLYNASIPDMVKIGRTQGVASARAAQLGTTGVPTPFLVIYEKVFADCETAETFIHVLLENQGYRVAKNREFFRVPPTIAIDAVHTAFSQYGMSQSSKAYDREREAALPSVRSLLGYSEDNDPCYVLFERADAKYYGLGDEIMDENQGLQLYAEAAALGSPDAYFELSKHHLREGNFGREKGVYWLKRGADAGIRLCWLHLAHFYEARHGTYNFVKNPQNARKSYRHFFDGLDIDKICDREFGWRDRTMCYLVLRDYSFLITDPAEQDCQVDLSIIDQVTTKLSGNLNDLLPEDQQACGAQLREIARRVGIIKPAKNPEITLNPPMKSTFQLWSHLFRTERK